VQVEDYGVPVRRFDALDLQSGHYLAHCAGLIKLDLSLPAMGW
jgi:hypothetical protein